jgi:NDP-sugar pyrophosphorylase family protein
MIEQANNQAMPAIALLSGGLATRLRPITMTIPKSMVRVAGEPFVSHQIRMLVREGFRDIVLLCGFLGEQLEEFVGNGAEFGCRVRYSFDGDTLRGTGGALRKALPLLGSEFMVIYGDSYCPTNYRRIYEAFVHSRKLGLMTVFHNQNRWDKSNVEFEANRIVHYDKRNPTPSMQYIDYGISAFRAEAFASWSEDSVFDLSVVQENLVASGELAGLEVAERFYEIGSHAGLQETEELLSSKDEVL